MDRLAQLKIKIPDKVISIAILALIASGLLALFSTTGGAFFYKQIIYFAVALGIVGLSYLLFDLKFFEEKAIWIYWLNVSLLLFLKVFGTTVYGSQRWLRLGFISVQPSEIAKICIIIALAAWLAQRPIKNFKDIFVTLFMVSLPAGLVFIQPDLGTTLVYGAISFGMLYWAGASLVQLLILVSPLIMAITSSVGFKIFTFEHSKFGFSFTVPALIFLIVLAIAVARHYKVWKCPWKTTGLFILLGANSLVMLVRPVLWGLLKEYQQKRLTIFLDPNADPLGAGYHILQSLYAIGSGGFVGKGFQAGDLTQGSFVPEQHTDFIFSVIGEEFGFIGGIILVILYAVLCIRIIQTAYTTEDKFASLTLIGIFSMFIFHIFVNIGMNLSLMPITGVPLPFVSYGGTSMLVDLFLMSLVLKTSSMPR